MLGLAVIDLGAAYIFGDEKEILDQATAAKMSLANITLLDSDVRDSTGSLVDPSRFALDVLDLTLVSMHGVVKPCHYCLHTNSLTS